MPHYRFYLLVGSKIRRCEDRQCADDDDAAALADTRLSADGPIYYDAVEVWQGTRIVCRRGRAMPP